TTEFGARVLELMARSHQPQGLELRELFAQRHFDAQVQRHVCARATGAHPGQLHVRAVAVDRDDLDVAAVGLEQRPDAIQHVLDLLLGDHDSPRGNAHATASAPETRHFVTVLLTGFRSVVIIPQSWGKLPMATGPPRRRPRAPRRRPRTDSPGPGLRPNRA